MEAFPVVRIEWVDAKSTPKWVALEDFLADGPEPCVTVGRLAKQDESGFWITETTNEEECSGIVIPAGCVTSFHVLEHA